MNAEELRRLTLVELVAELKRQLELSRCCDPTIWNDPNPLSDAPLPLLSVGDFDIYPRSAVLHWYVKLVGMEPWD